MVTKYECIVAVLRAVCISVPTKVSDRLDFKNLLDRSLSRFFTCNVHFMREQPETIPTNNDLLLQLNTDVLHGGTCRNCWTTERPNAIQTREK